MFAKLLWVIRYATHYGPVREWALIFAKLLWVIKYSTHYGPIHKWAFIFAKLCGLLSTVQIKDLFVYGYLYSPNYRGLLQEQIQDAVRERSHMQSEADKT